MRTHKTADELHATTFAVAYFFLQHVCGWEPIKLKSKWSAAKGFLREVEQFAPQREWLMVRKHPPSSPHIPNTFDGSRVQSAFAKYLPRLAITSFANGTIAQHRGNDTLTIAPRTTWHYCVAFDGWSTPSLVYKLRAVDRGLLLDCSVVVVRVADQLAVGFMMWAQSKRNDLIKIIFKHVYCNRPSAAI